jgi:fido (protein-threonine AMPylation protein)
MNRRQEAILRFIDGSGSATTSAIHRYASEALGEKVSRITVIRDINSLVHSGLIGKEGRARGIKYNSIVVSPPLKYFDVDNYFRNDCDSRSLKSKGFCFDIFNHLDKLFTENELNRISLINDRFRSNLKKLTPTISKKEFERLTIEFSWKSSRIEGNTYSLLDTERLVRENIEAKGHAREEAVMILNHKRVLDYILYDASHYNFITLSKIEELHEMLTQNLNVGAGLRSSPVGILGTNYRPLDNAHQIRDAMDQLIAAVNAVRNPFEKAFIIVLMISYIQPFEDGNKRTSRILANAVLLAGNYCPLSYRSVDETEYKKATILFYEQNSALCFKNLFTEQFEQAVDKYFGA